MAHLRRTELGPPSLSCCPWGNEKQPGVCGARKVHPTANRALQTGGYGGTPKSGCHGGEGSCLHLLPKNTFGRAGNTPNSETPPPTPKLPGGRGVPGPGPSTWKGWGSCPVCEHSQIPAGQQEGGEEGCCSCMPAPSSPHPSPGLARQPEVRINAAHSSVSDSTPQNTSWTHFPRESLMGFVVPKPQAMPHFHPLMQAIYQETLTEQGGFLTRGSWEQSANTPLPSLRPPVLCIPGNVNREASARSSLGPEEPVWGRRQQLCCQSALGGFAWYRLKCLKYQRQRCVPGESIPGAGSAPALPR